MIDAFASALVLLAIVNLWIGRSLLYPPVLFSLAWVANLLALGMAGPAYYPVGEDTLLLFVAGAVALSFGGALVLLLDATAGPRAAVRAVRVARRRVTIDRLIDLGVWLTLLTLPLRALRLRQLAGGPLELGSPHFWYLVRRATIAESDRSAITLLSLTDNIVLFASFLALAAVASDAEQRRMRLRTIVIVLLAVVYQVSTASRASGMSLVCGLIGIVWMTSGRWSLKSIATGVVGVVVVFSFAAVLMGKGGRVDATLVENVVGVARASVLYFVGPLVAFDRAYADPASVPAVWSVTYSVVQVLNKLGAGIALPSIHAVFTQVGPGAWMNAYTIYFAYVPDAGAGGALVLLAIVGALLTFLYRRGLAGSPHARLLYASAISGLLLSGFAEYFFMNLSYFTKAALFSLLLYGLPALDLPRLRATHTAPRSALPTAPG